MATCNCNITRTGDIVCIDTPFEIKGNKTLPDVETIIALPAGTTHSSSTPSIGSIDLTDPLNPVWDIASLPLGTTGYLALCVEITDEAAFSASDRTITATTTPVPGEVDLGDNETTRVLATQTCADIAGCVNANVVIVTGPTYNVTNEAVIEGDTSSNAITINLPADPDVGQTVRVKLIEATNTMTIDGNGNNIDDTPTKILSVLWEAMTLIFNGTFWSIY